jgi:hypothetical protein
MPWPLIIQGVGLGLQFLGGLFSGRAAKQAGQAEAERQNFNAQIADLQADDALQRGVDLASRQRMLTRQVVGTQRAGYGGQNVDVGVGSAVDVQADAALLGELDAKQIQFDAEREAWGYRVAAADRRLAAEVARKTGNAQGNAAYFGAAGTLLTGSALLVDKYRTPKAPKPATSVRVFET